RLTYEAAFKIWKAFKISVRWLATGEGSQIDSRPLPTIEVLKIKRNAPFLAVFEMAIVSNFRPFDMYDVEVDHPHARYIAWEHLTREMKHCLAMVPNEKLKEFVGSLLNDAEKLIGAYGLQTQDLVWARGLEIEQSAKFVGDPDSDSVLTYPTEFRKYSASMKAALPELLKKVRKLTKPKGTKARLASDLGVPQSRVSEWLNEKHEPSGEITLRLLYWCEERERQAKKIVQK
ncbi:MAG TPA: helix-turn-helix transcriptional regulator, partial [Sedimentisphaerales bacterium]